VDIRKSRGEDNWPEEEGRDGVQKCNDKDRLFLPGGQLIALREGKTYSF